MILFAIIWIDKTLKYCWKKLCKHFPWVRPSKETHRFGIWLKEESVLEKKMKLNVKKPSKLQIVVYILMIFIFASVLAFTIINYSKVDFLGLMAEVLGFVVGIYLVFYLIPKWIYKKIKCLRKNSKVRK